MTRQGDKLRYGMVHGMRTLIDRANLDPTCAQSGACSADVASAGYGLTGTYLTHQTWISAAIPAGTFGRLVRKAGQRFDALCERMQRLWNLQRRPSP